MSGSIQFPFFLEPRSQEQRHNTTTQHHNITQQHVRHDVEAGVKDRRQYCPNFELPSSQHNR
jgi:hypothetical protein